MLILPKLVWGGGPPERRWRGACGKNPSTSLRLVPLPIQRMGRTCL